LTIDEAFIFEAQAGSFCEMRITLGGLSAQHSHHRDPLLLRVRTERPHCRYTANQGNEGSPSHVPPSVRGIVPTKTGLLEEVSV